MTQADHHTSQVSDPRRLRIALGQINSAVGAIEGNLAHIREVAGAAYLAGANIVCFPELAITGYPPEDLLLRPAFISDNLAARDELVAASLNWPGMTVVAGFVDRESDLFNAAAIIRGGTLHGVYHKRYLPNYGVFDEDRYFANGTEAPVWLIDGVNVGINICEDIWYPTGPATLQAYAGAELLLNISASPFFVGKQVERESMLATRAADTGAMLAYLNTYGGQDELIFDGSSVIFNGEGKLIARAKGFEEDLLVVDLEIDDVLRTRLHDPRRRKYHLGFREEPEPVRLISAEPTRQPPTTRVSSRVERPLTRHEEAWKALVLGTGDYMRKSGFTDALVALSGGIDSALTVVIAVAAAGADHVTGISMPSRYSSQGSRDDARDLAERLGIAYQTVPIEETFSAALATLRPAMSDLPRAAVGLAEENLQARIRGNFLMSLSNATGAIALTTGNKSEMAVGYATLYGDMAGGYAVLKDVFKTFVYDLARWYNEQEGREIIPASTLTKPPSAELRPDQLDADSLPPYEILDPILEAYVEDDMSIEQIVRRGFDPAVVRRVMDMVDRSEYKRRQAAPGVKITGRAFGRDRRLPIANRYRGGNGAFTPQAVRGTPPAMPSAKG
ncbi:MAG TPA: NAD+ synthase, partial [Ktedonobacterales bacterium]